MSYLALYQVDDSILMAQAPAGQVWQVLLEIHVNFWGVGTKQVSNPLEITLLLLRIKLYTYYWSSADNTFMATNLP